MYSKTFIVGGVLAALLLGTVLVGCGQKGPLFLPEEDQQSEFRRNY